MCIVNGCTAQPNGRSPYCATHRKRWRRHGDAQQQTIRAVDLKVYRHTVSGILDRDKNGKIMAVMTSNWEKIIAYARDEVEQYRKGKPFQRHVRKSCEELVKLADSVTVRDLLEVGLAMFLMREWDGRKFASDRGFIFQLARRVRALTDLNVGTHYNHATGKVHRTYRDLPPKVTTLLAQALVGYFSRAAGHVISIAKKDWEEQQRKSCELDEAFAELETGGA